MATKKKTATKRKKATPAKKKTVDESAWEKASEESRERFQPGVGGTGVVVVERGDVTVDVAVLACGCDEAMAYVCDGSDPECANPNAVPLDDPREVASSFPVDVKIADLPKKKPSPIIVDDPYDDRPVDKEKLDAAMKDLGPVLGSGNVIVIESDPPRPSGHCFYGVMLKIKISEAVYEASRKFGIKLTRFDDPHLIASCRDFASSGSFTTTRDMLTQDHMMRLREFCKKSGVPFRAQWVFTT